MSSRIARRLISILALPLLLLGTNGDVLGRHPCAHHDGPIAPSASESHTSHASAPDEQEHESCTCVGTCSSPGTVASPAVASSFVAPVSPVRVIRPAPASPEVGMQPRFLIPFATAPPLVA